VSCDSFMAMFNNYEAWQYSYFFSVVVPHLVQWTHIALIFVPCKKTQKKRRRRWKMQQQQELKKKQKKKRCQAAAVPGMWPTTRTTTRTTAAIGWCCKNSRKQLNFAILFARKAIKVVARDKDAIFVHFYVRLIVGNTFFSFLIQFFGLILDT